MKTKIELGETMISIPIGKPDTMEQTTKVLKEYIKVHFPGVYAFSLIGNLETLSLILPDLVFQNSEDSKIKSTLHSFVNDGGVEISVWVISYSNFKVGHLHLEPIKNGRVYNGPIKYAIYDYSEYRNDEFAKIEKAFEPTTKEEFVEMIKNIIRERGLDLERENLDMLLVGHPAKLAKVFPGIEFTSAHGLLYRFMATIIEGFHIHCVAYENNNESDPLQLVIYKRQDV